MPDDSSRGGWLRGIAGGSGKKTSDDSPRIGKPLSVALAEKPPAAAQASPNRSSRGVNFRPGQLFHHFRLQQQLGRGATATVFRAVDERTSSVVALKLLALADDWPDDLLDEAKLRLLREAEAAGSLAHPDIVEIREAGEHEGQVYLAMEYVEGVNLATHATEGRMLPPRLVCEMCARVADALYFAHQRGVIHRDIKPANIVFDQKNRRVRVMDFGVARLENSRATRTGVILGSPSYMAPEQLDARPVTPQSDLFLARRVAVPAAHRHAAVSFGFDPGTHAEDLGRTAPAAARRAPRPAGGARGDHRSRTREGAGGPLPERRRNGASAARLRARHRSGTALMGRYLSLRSRVQAVGLTDTGKVREHNEDSIALDGDIGLFVLADGMGGYNAGEVASGIAVKTITNLVREAYVAQELEGSDKTTGLHRPSIILRDAIARANKIIHQTSKSQTQCEGMGTTVVAALLHDNRITVAHVGDSRMYRLRKDTFEQLTMDHSLLQELVDRGFYSAEEAQRATNKNYVTRALGVEQTVEVEVHELPVEAGDWLVLCSDGLTDMVEDEDIHLTISTFGGNLDTVARQLVQLANDSGGRDNISVVLAQVVELFPARRGILDRILAWFG